jgi:hypothetical protein
VDAYRARGITFIVGRLVEEPDWLRPRR